jgi:hypothetical protein
LIAPAIKSSFIHQRKCFEIRGFSLVFLFCPRPLRSDKGFGISVVLIPLRAELRMPYQLLGRGETTVYTETANLDVFSPRRLLGRFPRSDGR